MKCRHCGAALTLPMIDLGSAPPSNAYLSEAALRAPEKWFPLRVLVCTGCWLVQTEDHAGADELFAADYAYFSSYSNSWLAHAEDYAATMTQRFGLSDRSQVIEVAANDGYLLQYFKARGIPCLGIEPTAATAAAARSRGIDIVQEFFGQALARRLSGTRPADLMVANNVLAHVPDINDFAAGFAQLLKPAGVATFEFPHLSRLVEHNQFDTIYHEHFSYLSLTSARRILDQAGLEVFDVEELSTHGGSLRVFAQRSGAGQREIGERVPLMIAAEQQAGLTTEHFHAGCQARADRAKDEFVSFLIEAKRSGKRVVAYGAAAKGNTLLNYAGIRPDLIAFVVDRNPAKQGRFMPGSRIPIVDEAQLRSARPGFVVVLPWNLKTEISQQLGYIRGWGGRFVVAIPELQIF
jgi:SAM-dependent methyltransferase